MGIWRRREPSRQRLRSSPITLDRKVVRFRRLIEQHGEVLDLLADLKDKQSGEYVLDRQYIEARLDRSYEGVRRILYDMQVLTDSENGEGYEELDRLRSSSEKVVKEAALAGRREPQGEEALDWETLALQALFHDLTRTSSYCGAGAEAAPAAPQSLVEWAGSAHLKAAEWITDKLPSVSGSPTTTLRDQTSEALSIQTFVLGGAGGEADKLKQCLVSHPSGIVEDPFAPPVSYFFEGLRRLPDGTGFRNLCTAAPERAANRDARSSRIQLYASEGFLLLRLPPSLPVRLFGCSLSVDDRENLLYFFGTPLPSFFERRVSGPFSSAAEPFPAHGCAIAGKWVYWATQFSWAQGEERVRMLGHSLSRCIPEAGEGGAMPEEVARCLGEGILLFLKEVVGSDRAFGLS